MSPKKGTTPSKESKKHEGSLSKALRVRAIAFQQGGNTLYMFVAKSSVLFAALSINRRAHYKTKEEGFQRVLALSRVDAVNRYITERKRPIPGAIIVSLDKAKFDGDKNQLTIPAGTDVGWVIDGQHRLAGAASAAKNGTDVELPVVAYLGVDQKFQIEQFITINREAKNVPTSLYLDLLKHRQGVLRSAPSLSHRALSKTPTPSISLPTTPSYRPLHL